MIWLPLLATALYTASTVQRKLFLKSSRIPFDTFYPAVLMLIAGMGLVLAPFDWRLDPGAFDLVPLGLLLLAVILGTYWFQLFYQALREEPLARYDLLALLEPLATLVLVSLLYPTERDPRIWCAAVIACGALYLGHKNGHRLVFDQGERHLIGAILISAVIVAIQRYLLAFYSAPAFNAVYTVGVAWLFACKYGSGWLGDLRRFGGRLLLTAFLIMANSICFLYSYKLLGVTLTTLIMLLEPVAVAFIAYFFLKEPVKPKLLAAGLVVLATIAVTLWLIRPA